MVRADRKKGGVSILALCLAASLGGCTSSSSLSGLSGAASMRIEVEVYKGPLSKEPDVQWGELMGVVEHTPVVLGYLDDAVLTIASAEGYLPPKGQVYSDQIVGLQKEMEATAALTESLLKQIREDAEYLDDLRKSWNGQVLSGHVVTALDDMMGRFREYGRYVADPGKEINVLRLRVLQNKRAFHALLTLLDPKGTDIALGKVRLHQKELFNQYDQELLAASLVASKGYIAASYMDGHAADFRCDDNSCEAKFGDVEQALNDLGNVSGKRRQRAGTLQTAAAQYFNHIGLVPIGHVPVVVRPHLNEQSLRALKVDPGVEAVGLERGAVSGRYNIELADDYGAWCSSGKFMNGKKGLLGQLGDLSCLHSAELHRELQRFIAMSRQVAKDMDNVNGMLYGKDGVAQKCDSKNSDDSCQMVVRKFRAETRKVVAKVSELAIELKASAFYWVESQIPAMTQADGIATLVLGYSVAAAELSNQMQSKADVLEKQLSVNRRYQPLSSYLRDSDSTDFTNLFIWNRPFSGSIYDALSNGSAESRVTGIERLFADHNWSKINTAYASGQGDVSMAFIKDDIGNWNLKSFSNDPSELLDSYTAVGKALLETAVTAASGGAGAATRLLTKGALSADNLKQLENAADSGRRMAFGNEAASEGADIQSGLLAEMKAKAIEQLKPLKDQLAAVQAAAKQAAAGVQSIKRVTFNQLPAEGDILVMGNASMVFTAAKSDAEPTKVQILPDDLAGTIGNLVTALGTLDPAYSVHQAEYEAESDNILKVTQKSVGATGDTFPLRHVDFGSWGGRAHLQLPKGPAGQPDPGGQAEATFTLNRLPVAGQSVSIGGTVYEFVAPGGSTSFRQVEIAPAPAPAGSNRLAATIKNLEDALNDVSNPSSSRLLVRDVNISDTSLTVKNVGKGTDGETVQVGLSGWAGVALAQPGKDAGTPKPDLEKIRALQAEIIRILGDYQIRIETLQRLTAGPKEADAG